MSGVGDDKTGFVHLRVRSEYSMTDGLAKVEDLAQTAADLGMPALALTDRGSLSGYLKFYSGCLERGIKPIAGLDIPYVCEDFSDEVSRCLLLAANVEGYASLLDIIFGLRKLPGSNLRTATRELIFGNSKGLIALSGGIEGDVGKALQREDESLARSHLDAWTGSFKDAYYLELQRCGRAVDSRIEPFLLELAARHSVPVVATNEVMFERPEDFEIHEIRVCIQEKRVIDDETRERRYTEDMWLKGAAEMAEAFSDIPEALQNSIEIAKRCNLHQSFYQPAFPRYPVPEGETLDQHLGQCAREGLEERTRGKELSEKAREVYNTRLTDELEVICSMEYAAYFLVVMSIIRWAKSQGIPVGPGRGSGAGSLVAWTLGITGLDPIEHGLLFERFLNTERVSLPDFDVDICMERREMVLQHIADKFGRDSVAQIVTYGTMGAKAVVRDVARAQGKPFKIGDTLARLVPMQLDISLQQALDGQPELRRLMEEDPDYAEVMNAAFRLEGRVRNEGIHAAGVVIAPSRLSDFLPATVTEQGDAVTQFDWKDVEKAGLIKFDFLGLRTLTVIDHTLRSIQENHNVKVDIENIPLDDEKTFKLLQEARTKGIFQLESDGLRNLILQIKPKELADLTALLALFRPGPLQSGMVDDFIKVRAGKVSAEYLHPEMKQVIEPTSGIILFQEQVMQLAQILAGFSLGQADVLRAAMGKKNREIMAEQRSRFVDGAVANGVKANIADQVFDLMDKFAGYGFNRSHSTAYAVISYQTAWLKANYPAEFMAAMLTSELQHRNAIHKLMPEVSELGLEVLPPDVNRSHPEFRAEGKGVRYGLGGIKDVGHLLIERIVAARESGAFESLVEFASRVGARYLQAGPLKRLIHAGALDEMSKGSIDERRAHLLSMVDDALNWVAQRERGRSSGVDDMFDEAGELPELENGASRPLTDLERLKLEDQALGFYLTGHPMKVYARECVKLFSGEDQSNSRRSGTGRGRFVDCSFAGIITHVNHRGRGEGETWARLENGAGHVEAGFYGDVLRTEREKLSEGEYLLIEGSKLQSDRPSSFGARMRVSKAFTLGEARQKFAGSLDLDVQAEDSFDALQEVLSELCSDGQSSSCRVRVYFRNDSARALIRLPREFSILPSEENLHRLREVLGTGRVRLNYKK